MDLIRPDWLTNDLHRTTENELYDKDASHNVTTALPAGSKKKVSNKTRTNLMSLLGSYHLFWLKVSIYFVIKNRRKKSEEVRNMNRSFKNQRQLCWKLTCYFPMSVSQHCAGSPEDKRFLAVLTDKSKIEILLWELGPVFANAIQQQSF